MSESFSDPIKPVRDLSEAKRALLARRLALRGAAGNQAIPPRQPDSEVVLSGAQEEIWVQEVGTAGRLANNLASAWRVRGSVNLPVLQLSINQLAMRHEILRTTYLLTPDGPRQLIADTSAVVVETRSVTQGPAGSEVADSIVQEWVRRPFDLSSGAPIRVCYLQLADSEGILVVVIHHIAIDGVSRNVLFEELSALYAAALTGDGAALEPVAVQYGDFAVWERDAQQQSRYDAQLARWKERLASAPEALDFPTDRPRTNAPVFDGGMSRCTLPLSVLADVRAAALRLDATPFMLLFAAFNAMLSRFTGETDIVVGVPVARRLRPELSRAVGFYANTVAVRTAVTSDPTFSELVARVRDATLAAFDDQDVPFARVQAALHELGRPSHAPVFQVMFALQNFGLSPLQLPDVKLDPVAVPIGATKFELTLLASEREEGLRLVLEHRLDLFDSATADRLVATLGRIVAAAALTPELRVSELPVLSDEDRTMLLATSGNADAVWPETATLHELFAAQAERTPDAIAVQCEGDAITYRELERRSNALAWRLYDMGVKPDSLVAVCMEKSVDVVAAMLGVLKAGGAYVPMDSVYPDERLAFMLEDSGVRIVLTDVALASRVQHNNVMPLLAADVWRDGRDSRGEAPTVAVAPEHLCYVIYTSGSTGQPKGVLVEHRNVVRLLFNDRFQFDFSERDVWTVFHSFAFDFSVWEMYGALLRGARCIVVPRAVAQDPAEFLALLGREQVTVLNQVPSAFYALMQSELSGAPHTLALRYVIFGGEALQPALLRDWKQRFPHTRLINMFGITETTVHVTYKEIGDAEIASGTSNIGTPIPTLSTYVLDDRQQLVPVGVTGEICVGGAGVARGYLNRPVLTAERFIPHPFRNGERMYRSGDLGRMRLNGEIEYIGRGDSQVKLRGFRIELGEIQSALASHEAVAQAAVLLRDEGEPQLAAYVVPDAARAGTIRRLAALERAATPAAALPEHYELPNGLTVFHRNRSETDFLFKEIFQGSGYLNHGLTIEDGDTVFDVGGNIGLFTVFAGTHARDTRVYAFEPLPPLFAALNSNAVIHAIPGRMFACGLGSRDESVTFTYYPQNTVISGRFADERAETEVVRRYLTNVDAQPSGQTSLDELLTYTMQSEQYECSIRTLSDIIAEEGIERIDLLKVDVEKAEWDVLMGIRDEDWPKVQQIVMEVHDENGRLEQTLNLLRGKGFECVAEEEAMLVGTGLYALYAKRPGHRAGEPLPERSPKAVVWRGADTLRADLLAYLRQTLPEYMVPTNLIFLDSIPLTSSGKLDRKALPNSKRAVPADLPPVGPIEEVIASVWRETLQLEWVGRNTSFFELGGHSLLVTRVIGALQKLLRVQLPLRAMFDAPTVSGTAQALVAREAAPGSTIHIAKLVQQIQRKSKADEARVEASHA